MNEIVCNEQKHFSNVILGPSHRQAQSKCNVDTYSFNNIISWGTICVVETLQTYFC